MISEPLRQGQSGLSELLCLFRRVNKERATLRQAQGKLARPGANNHLS